MAQLPPSQVFILKELLNYQEGSVVSRSLLGKRHGNITLFAFVEGEGLSEHTAPFDACAYVVEGEAKITISGSDYHLREGELLILPAHQPHALKAVRDFKMLLVMIKSAERG